MDLCTLQAPPAYTNLFGMENKNDNWRATNQASPQDTSVQRRMAIANISSSTPERSSSTNLPASPTQGPPAQRDQPPLRLPSLARTISASQPPRPEERLGNFRSRNDGVTSPEIDVQRVPAPYPPRATPSDSGKSVGGGLGPNQERPLTFVNYAARASPQDFSPPKRYQEHLSASKYPSDPNVLPRSEVRSRAVHPQGGSFYRCPDCADVTSITHQVISSLLVLELEVQSTISEKPSRSQSPPDTTSDGSWKALNWALDTIQESSKVLRQRRGQHGSLSPYSNEFKRKDDLATDDHTAKRSRTGSVSSMQMSQPKVSPSGHVPPGSWAPPTTTIGEDKARTAHSEDLQHQLSVKTMKLSSLQREHDNLLQKLDRQRTKCATLERKFETSDMEINSLSDERERLQSQITVLESQVETLQKDRDEARSQSVANNGQYLKIVELSSRLQKQAAEDKKRWNAERAELLSTLRQAREQTLMRDHPSENAKPEHGELRATVSEKVGMGQQKVTENVSDGDCDPSWLDEESDPCDMNIEELRTRNKLLRLALIDMKKDIHAIQHATHRINARGNNLKTSLEKIETKSEAGSSAKSIEA